MRRLARLLLPAILLPMACAEFVAPFAYDEQSREDIAAPPSRRHLLGTDAVGRDRLSRLLYGGRLSIVLAPAAAVLSLGIALAAGVSAAVAGGWWERAILYLIDLVLSLPWLFLLLAVRAMLPLNTSPGVSLAVVFGLLGLLGWAAPARVLFAAARRQLGADYILFARAGGQETWHIALAHLLPNLAPIALAQFWTATPSYLLSEANLSLLGLGVAEPLPSWGNLLRELQNVSSFRHQPWVAVPLVTMVLVLSCCQAMQTPEEYPE